MNCALDKTRMAKKKKGEIRGKLLKDNFATERTTNETTFWISLKIKSSKKSQDVRIAIQGLNKKLSMQPLMAVFQKVQANIYRPVVGSSPSGTRNQPCFFTGRVAISNLETTENNWASIALHWIKLLSVTSEFILQHSFGAQLFHFWSSPLIMLLQKQQKMRKVPGPLPFMLETRFVIDFVATWEANKQMKTTLLVSFHLSYSVKWIYI